MAPRRRERQQLAGLCDLVSASLLHHLEPVAPPPRKLTREDERRLLLALSRVNKAIRGWDEGEVNEEQGSESDEETPCPKKMHSCCLPPLQHLDDGFGCLVNIVSILIGFLGFCSEYVKHSAGNILIAMSSTIIKIESIWIQYIELIWVAIHAPTTCVHNGLPSQNGSSSHDITLTRTSITSFMVVLNRRSVKISGEMMASLFRVLHAILKFLKHSDNEVKDDFICLSIHHIQKMPWESVHQPDAGELVSLAKDSRFNFCNDLAQSGILAGSLLQLLCSLLEQTSLEGTDGQDMYVKLVDVVPKLADFLLGRHDGPQKLYQYSRHKILMVMMRLNPYMQQNCSHIVCSMKLLKKYFQDLLTGPICQHIGKQDNCLEGSPFLLNMIGLVEIPDKSTWHLRRQATYLFLSCCICLCSNTNNGSLQCSCKRDDCLLGQVQGCIDHCNCFGLSEISDWFQRCYFDRSFGPESSTDFALSFLQLYMEEDDMLFNILLQLLDAPSIFMKMDSMEPQAIGARLFSNIFDPVHLFHLFLLLLHYDHLVLVDYLISKDVGVHCAQYLLRCLRLLSQSWHAFVDDSVYQTKIEKLDCKRQRTSNDKDISSASGSSIIEREIHSSFDKEGKNAQKLFLNAKICLLSLKRTVEDLRKKGLFPYNPKPLIRSLTRFEELCEQG